MFPFILFTIFVLLFFFTAYILAKRAITAAKSGSDLKLPFTTWVIGIFTIGFGASSCMWTIFGPSRMSELSAPALIAIGIGLVFVILLIWVTKRMIKHYYPQVIFLKEFELPIEKLGEKRIGRGLLFSAM
jgi:hypothetical protein